MTKPSPRAVLGVILGLALATTAAWLAILLARGDQPSPTTQAPSAPTNTTSPTETTAAPQFTRDGAVAGLRIIVRKRLEAFNTLDASLLETLYTSDCRLADGSSCLREDEKVLNDLRRKDQRLDGYPNAVQEIKVLSWEPETRTAVMSLVYESLPSRIVNSRGEVVEEVPGTKRVIDQVNLVWDGIRWRQAWGGTIRESQ
jgi:hypothetical protein